MKIKISIIIILFSLALPFDILAQSVQDTQAGEGESLSIEQLKQQDGDNDGLSDYEELYVYRSNKNESDSDSDGYLDGDEVRHNYDPNQNGNDKLEKNIVVSIDDQSLSYMLGGYIVESFKISSGAAGFETPKGEYKVLKKRPVVDYKGPGYGYLGTKWNLLFKYQSKGNLYIHGAYWHNNFGNPMSHGCINVAYQNMEGLYNWADLGTKITIK